jgi:hypothetical protein
MSMAGIHWLDTVRMQPFLAIRRCLGAIFSASQFARKTFPASQKAAHWRWDVTGRVQPAEDSTPRHVPLNR